jgi:hypothetical protein
MEMESIRRRFHHNILKNHNNDAKGGKNRLRYAAPPLTSAAQRMTHSPSVLCVGTLH